jgi:hypothetical protein
LTRSILGRLAAAVARQIKPKKDPQSLRPISTQVASHSGELLDDRAFFVSLSLEVLINTTHLILFTYRNSITDIDHYPLNPHTFVYCFCFLFADSLK